MKTFTDVKAHKRVIIKHGDKKIGSFKMKSYQPKPIMKTIKEIAWGTFCIAVCTLFVVGFAQGYVTLNPRVVEAQVPVDVSYKVLADKIDSMKMDVVETIRSCESGGYKGTGELIKYDPSDKDISHRDVYSYGTLQFKVYTVIGYYKLFYGTKINPSEAILIALNDEKSGLLAKDVIFKTAKMADDWHNCAVKTNVEVKIRAIKLLEKSLTK